MLIRSLLILFALSATFLSGAESEIHYNGGHVKVKGNHPAVGEKAPIVRVTERDFSIKTIGGKSDRVQVLMTVPSIDMPVCSIASKRFDDEIKKFPNVDMTVVSMDRPYADDRFWEGRGIENITIASDFAYREVGIKYGVSITEGEHMVLLVRAVFVIGKSGKIVYQESGLCIHKEPDYAKVMHAIKMADAPSK